MSKRSKTRTNTLVEEKKKKQNILNPIIPKTPGQEVFLNSIKSHEIVICDGPSGSGKTLLSFGTALDYYFKGNVKRIIIIRPNVAAGDDSELGFLPGSLNDKMLPFLLPIVRDSASLLLKQNSFRTNMNHNDRGSPEPLSALLNRVDIEIVPLSFLRGRTFSESFIILDEAQNCTKNDFKLFLTRIGENSKVIIEGDSTQADINDSGFSYLQNKLSDMEEIKIVKLEFCDIVRNPLISKILKRFS